MAKERTSKLQKIILEVLKEMDKEYSSGSPRLHSREKVKARVKEKHMRHYGMTEDNKDEWEKNPKYRYFFKRATERIGRDGLPHTCTRIDGVPCARTSAFDVSLHNSIKNLIKKGLIVVTYKEDLWNPILMEFNNDSGAHIDSLILKGDT